MQFLRAANYRQLDLGLLVIRVAAGLTMAAHGWQKVFVMGPSNVAVFFGKAGVPIPGFTGPFIAFLELFGGVALALGLFTRPIALLLAIDMLAAAAIVHLANGFFMPTGAELVVLLAAMYVGLAIAGGGTLSVDAMIAKPDENHARR